MKTHRVRLSIGLALSCLAFAGCSAADTVSEKTFCERSHDYRLLVNRARAIFQYVATDAKAAGNPSLIYEACQNAGAELGLQVTTPKSSLPFYDYQTIFFNAAEDIRKLAEIGLKTEPKCVEGYQAQKQADGSYKTVLNPCIRKESQPKPGYNQAMELIPAMNHVGKNLIMLCYTSSPEHANPADLVKFIDENILPNGLNVYAELKCPADKAFTKLHFESDSDRSDSKQVPSSLPDSGTDTPESLKKVAI